MTSSFKPEVIEATIAGTVVTIDGGAAHFAGVL